MRTFDINISDDKIRIFNNNSSGLSYFCYDLYFSGSTKRRRFYGKTKEEVRQKVYDYLKNLEYSKALGLSEDNSFSAAFMKYMSYISDSLTYKENRRLVDFCNREILHNEIDLKCEELTQDIISQYYINLYERFPLCVINEIHKYIVGTIELSHKAHLMGNVNPDKIIIPEVMPEPCIPHVISKRDLIRLMNTGMFDRGIKYGGVGKAVALSVLTGTSVLEITRLNGAALNIEEKTLTVNKYPYKINPEGFEWLETMAEDRELSFGEDEPLIKNRKGGYLNALSFSTFAKRMFADVCLRDDLLSKDVENSILLWDYYNGIENNGESSGESIARVVEKYGKSKSRIMTIIGEYKRGSLYSN